MGLLLSDVHPSELETLNKPNLVGHEHTIVRSLVNEASHSATHSALAIRIELICQK